MKNLKELLNESISKKDLTKDNITLQDLKDAFFHSSFMNDDRSWIRLDGDSYVKIKKDTWEKQSTQAHTFQPTYDSSEMLDLIKKAKEVDLTNVNFK